MKRVNNLKVKEKKKMGSVEIILRDDEGNIINHRTKRKYEVELGRGTVHELESAVEKVKREALPDITADY
jgi:hypothetical protein